MKRPSFCVTNTVLPSGPPRCASRQLADGAALLETDDVQVACCIDRGAFDAGGVLARRRDPLAREQGVLGRIAPAREENGASEQGNRDDPC